MREKRIEGEGEKGRRGGIEGMNERQIMGEGERGIEEEGENERM